MLKMEAVSEPQNTREEHMTVEVVETSTSKNKNIQNKVWWADSRLVEFTFKTDHTFQWTQSDLHNSIC
jgi:hypothetical protein